MDSDNTLTEKNVLQVSYDQTTQHDAIYEDPPDIGSGQKTLKQGASQKSALSLKGSNQLKANLRSSQNNNNQGEK